MTRISIIGIGRVGSPLAVACAAAGRDIPGVEIRRNGSLSGAVPANDRVR